MDLLEAKNILNDNGYELLDEGKFGRALAAGALALGLTAGHANAINQDDIDRFEKQTEEEYKNVIYDDGELQIKKEGNVYYLEQDNEVNSEKSEIKSD